MVPEIPQFPECPHASFEARKPALPSDSAWFETGTTIAVEVAQFLDNKEGLND
jgi:hypothetical protein